MLADAYSRAVALTARFEGGWYDGTGSHDPNPTMKGVTQATYDVYRKRRGLPSASVRDITNEELADLYRQYWDAVRGDELPGPVAIVLFDHGFNAGPKKAAEVLQRAISVLRPVAIDGVIGPRTLAAANAVAARELFHCVLVERMWHYRRIALARKELRPALLAWLGRVVDTATIARAERWFDAIPPDPGPELAVPRAA